MYRANFFCRSLTKGFSSFQPYLIKPPSALHTPQRSYVSKEEIRKRKRAVKRKVREEVARDDPLNTKLQNASLITQMSIFPSTAFPGPVKSKNLRADGDVPIYNMDVPFEESVPETRRIVDAISKLKYAVGMLEAKLEEHIGPDAETSEPPEVLMQKITKIGAKLMQIQKEFEAGLEKLPEKLTNFDAQQFLSQIDQEARQDYQQQQCEPETEDDTGLDKKDFTDEDIKTLGRAGILTSDQLLEDMEGDEALLAKVLADPEIAKEIEQAGGLAAFGEFDANQDLAEEAKEAEEHFGVQEEQDEDDIESALEDEGGEDVADQQYLDDGDQSGLEDFDESSKPEKKNLRGLLDEDEMRTDDDDEADITDVDLDSYNLDTGDYIDAQTFLQDVSRFKVNDFPLEKRTRIVDMIEKARKILRLQREDREFWDDFTIIRQLHELTVLNANHYRPIVSPELKDNMYHLYASNPEEWTVGKLAQKFRMKKVKVEAILRLKIDEYIKARTEPWEISAEGDEIEEAYAEYFGWVGIDDWLVKEIDERMDISQPRWRSALVGSVDEEEDVSKLQRLAFRVQEKWDEMPETRPTGPGSYPAPVFDGQLIRKAQYKYKSRPRSEFIFIDSSPVENFEEQAKMFWLAKDGSMRHLTWEERVKVFKRGPFGDDRWTGGLAHLNTLTDPVIFPADAEEEKLLAEQLKPQWKNRRYAQAKVILERDILKQLDYAYGSIAPHKFKKTSYMHGRIPWSVQEALKQKRTTNVLDTIYKPVQMPPF